MLSTSAVKIFELVFAAILLWPTPFIKVGLEAKGFIKSKTTLFATASEPTVNVRAVPVATSPLCGPFVILKIAVL